MHRPPRVAAGDLRGEARAVGVPQHVGLTLNPSAVGLYTILPLRILYCA